MDLFCSIKKLLIWCVLVIILIFGKLGLKDNKFIVIFVYIIKFRVYMILFKEIK